ncbi:hypothetical protein ScPMuIL_000295 [Solemya velum]
MELSGCGSGEQLFFLFYQQPMYRPLGLSLRTTPPPDSRRITVNDYIVSTWVDYAARFSIATWNHYEMTWPRTNNNLEVHFRMNGVLSHHLHNIYRFVKSIQYIGIVSLSLLVVCSGLVQEIQMPLSLSSCFQQYFVGSSLSETVGSDINWDCLQHNAWRLVEAGGWNISTGARRWLGDLIVQATTESLGTGFTPRVRKEYRQMSDRERSEFHVAITRLKQDTSVPPNRYDVLAEIHTGPAIPSAHNGPNFYGWHRIYLVVYEDALREKVPGVTVPYWDSTLDFDLPDPTTSIIWTDSFLGNGDGAVTTGPFANWRTASGPLTRNIGSSSRLYSKESLQNIMTRTRMSEISYPSASPMYNLEFHHNGVHNWVDGQMAGLETAPQDPVFYMHHAYVDYLWELFRIRQREFGIDASLDYPSNYGEPVHSPNNAMDNMVSYTNIQGYDDFWMSSVYSYDRAPSCSWISPSCGSRYLRCDMTRSRCVSAESSATGGRRGQNRPSEATGLGIFSTLGEIPIASDLVRIQIGTRFVGPPSDGRTRMRRGAKTTGATLDTSPQRSVKEHLTENENILEKKPNSTVSKINDTEVKSVGVNDSSNIDTCPKSGIGGAFQNTFDINGISDMNLWVFLPVTIIHQRPSGAKFQSYAVHDGELKDSGDIYSPPTHTDLYSHLHSGQSSLSAECVTSPSGAGKVFVQSDGMNYMGRYKDYTVIDNRQPITKTTSYVAVMNPRFGATSVILTAYDSCGRICHPRCKVQKLGSSDYHPCSGVVDVTQVAPRQYGLTYSDAVSSVWNFENGDFPNSVSGNISVAFYCTNEKRWPWSY